MDKDKHPDFSNLPTSVLRMIKDRLDFKNNLRFAFVCKSWRDAWLSYSKDDSLCRESPPWLMIYNLEWSGRCEFISTSTEERFSIFHRDLNYHKETLFTKQGWLLLLGTGGLCSHLLLLNPFSNKKIELPDGFSWLLDYCKGAFTLADGKPDLVAFAGLDAGVKKEPYLRLWTIRMNDHNSLWTQHRVKIPQSWNPFRPRCLVIIGQNIYIVCRTLKFLVLNLSRREWSTGQHFLRPCDAYIDTNKGVLWNADPYRTGATLFRLNDNCRDSEKLKVEDLVNECWFIKDWPYDGYVVSKDIDAAISHELVKSGYLTRRVVPYYSEDDPKTVRQITVYMINNKSIVEWVDMPYNSSKEDCCCDRLSESFE
ncbi:hypothetical protein POM88_039046 [Heracleum sosnowskyi]|uniref:F-box domain-containing protein n=1 Tax=Heracleum sosnowskyi TaxID=360622 RepID=A0AAD8H9N6_9APIA|nr:hypothetical protein POM88_039046 [Heracleum sosnowskyi]